jgi:hypothetical protein
VLSVSSTLLLILAALVLLVALAALVAAVVIVAANRRRAAPPAQPQDPFADRDHDALSLRFLDAPTLQAAAVFPRDQARIAVEPSTLLQPRVLEYARTEWNDY